MGISQNASLVVFWLADFGITGEYQGGTSSINPSSRRSSKNKIFKAASCLYRYLVCAREEHLASTCATLSATFPHNLRRTSPSVEVCVFSFVWSFVGINCSYSSYIISDWWPDTKAWSSNSLTSSTVWSEFWYNFRSDLILVVLYSCSTDRRPLPPSVDITKKLG